MNKLYIVLACFIFTQHAFSQTDCSELLTLSSTPSSCNENGTITATVDGCETNLTNDINNCWAFGDVCPDDGDPNTYEYCENAVCISCLDTNQNNICDSQE